ncbi:hypothetical protein JB92DRAFT_1204722 [Gautieria morchelliformis]|nr:hypothetical protein JB92DRAFT_1204722 [Gautieria morchelliformis]
MPPSLPATPPTLARGVDQVCAPCGLESAAAATSSDTSTLTRNVGIPNSHRRPWKSQPPLDLSYDPQSPLQTWAPTTRIEFSVASTIPGTHPTLARDVDHPLQTSPPTAGLEVPTTTRVEFSTVARTSQIPYTVPPITFYWAPDARVTPKSQLTRPPISRSQRGAPHLIDHPRRCHATQGAHWLVTHTVPCLSVITLFSLRQQTYLWRQAAEVWRGSSFPDRGSYRST